MRKQCFFHCFIILTIIFSSESFDIYEEDFMNDQQMFQDLRTPEVIRRRKGESVALKCSIENCKPHRRHFKWEFLQCKSKNVRCEDNYYRKFSNDHKSDWRKIHSKQGRTTKCYHEQVIDELEPEDSGFYRCTINNQVIKVYQVDVIDTDKSDGSPKILELIPNDITVAINAQLIIQCKVYSPIEPPLIAWFKQCDGCVENHVVYNGTYYAKVNPNTDTSTIKKEPNIYLSKLNINKASLLDNGVYACVGVNGDSYNVETASVKVQSYQNWEPTTSFSLLFLIPLTFASVPVTVWLCYYKNKRKGNDRVVFQQEKKLIECNQNQIRVV